MSQKHPYQHLSVLQNAQRENVASQPFPYLVIENALPQTLADALTNQFSLNLFDDQKKAYELKHQTSPNNKRMDIGLAASQKMQNMPEIWQQFLEFHSSPQFFNQLLALFGEAIVRQFPKAYPSLADLQRLQVGTRFLDKFANKDVLLDTAMSINTPVTHTSVVRAIHADHGDKLFSGLYYLRRPQDDAQGSNLQILQWRKSYSQLQKRFFYQEGVDPKHCEVVREIPYANNTFVVFINSLDALHAVTPRSVTAHDRTFVNFVGVVSQKNFRKELPIVKKWRKMMRKQETTEAY